MGNKNIIVYPVRFDPEMWERLVKVAQQNDRSAAQEIRRAVRLSLEDSIRIDAAQPQRAGGTHGAS